MSSRRDEFISKLAAYLTRDLGARSIGIELGREDAKEWSHLYCLAGCSGYATAEEAERDIRRLFGIEENPDAK